VVVATDIAQVTQVHLPVVVAINFGLGSGTTAIQLNLLSHSGTFASCHFSGLLDYQPGTLAIAPLI